jgi:hypothetical protein
MSFQATINKEKYEIRFGNGAFRYLGKLWGCKGTGEVIHRLTELENISDTGLTFEQEDIVYDLIGAGMKCADPTVEIPDNDSLSSFIFDPVFLEKLFSELTDSFPKPKGNVIPKKAGKRMPKVEMN